MKVNKTKKFTSWFENDQNEINISHQPTKKKHQRKKTPKNSPNGTWRKVALFSWSPQCGVRFRGRDLCLPRPNDHPIIFMQLTSHQELGSMTWCFLVLLIFVRRAQTIHPESWRSCRALFKHYRVESAQKQLPLPWWAFSARFPRRNAIFS